MTTQTNITFNEYDEAAFEALYQKFIAIAYSSDDDYDTFDWDVLHASKNRISSLLQDHSVDFQSSFAVFVHRKYGLGEFSKIFTWLSPEVQNRAYERGGSRPTQAHVSF